MGWINSKRSVARRDGSFRSQTPVARSEGLVIEELGDELLVYDQASNHAHCLGAKAATVWRACNGDTKADALAPGLGLDEDDVRRALQELAECELLENGPPVLARNGGMTRRDLGFRVAKVGAAAAAAPMIWSITAPTSAAAATPTPAQCLLYTDSDCDNCTNICGCCCCCQAGGGPTEPSCKICYTTAGCSSFTCPDSGLGHCSATAKDPPKCEDAGTSYVCKDGNTVFLDETERCCFYT